jgi:hypothetical protein
MGAAAGRAGRGEGTHAGAWQPDPCGPAADPPDVAVSQGYGRCGSVRGVWTQCLRAGDAVGVFLLEGCVLGMAGAAGTLSCCVPVSASLDACTRARAGAVLRALAGARGAGTHATRALWRASASQGAACLSASFCARLQPHNGCKPAFCSRHAGCLLVLQVGCALALVVGTGLSVGSGQGSCFCCSCSGVLHDAPLAWPSCSSWAGRPTACRAAACDCRAGTGVLRRIVL